MTKRFFLSAVADGHQLKFWQMILIMTEHLTASEEKKAFGIGKQSLEHHTHINLNKYSKVKQTASSSAE